MKEIDEQIKELLERAKVIPQKTRIQKLKLYSEGLKAKLRQSEFSLAKLSEFQNKSDDTISSTQEDGFTITCQVDFYCDAFWVFLYSSLDVLAQIINQSLKLGLIEKKVSIKYIANSCSSTQIGTKLHSVIHQCIASKAFKNLDNYRNCSVHRRQIFISQKSSITTGTPGYTTGPQLKTVIIERIICDDPLILMPKTKQNRKIPDYLISNRAKIEKNILTILRNISPIT